MDAAALLADLRHRDVHIIAVGDDIECDHASWNFTPEDHAALQAAKPQLVSILQAEQAAAAEIAWRADAMRGQVPLTGVAPVLCARPDVTPAAGECLSCGDPLPPGRRYRCAPCQAAGEQVLAQPRAGP